MLSTTPILQIGKLSLIFPRSQSWYVAELGIESRSHYSESNIIPKTSNIGTCPQTFSCFSYYCNIRRCCSKHGVHRKQAQRHNQRLLNEGLMDRGVNSGQRTNKVWAQSSSSPGTGTVYRPGRTKGGSKVTEPRQLEPWERSCPAGAVCWWRLLSSHQPGGDGSCEDKPSDPCSTSCQVPWFLNPTLKVEVKGIEAAESKSVCWGTMRRRDQSAENIQLM